MPSIDKPDKPKRCCTRKDAGAGAGPSVRPFTRTQRRLLEVLQSRPGRAFTRGELLRMIMPGVVVLERTVDAHVLALRRKLADRAGSIRTVRKIGYSYEPIAPAAESRPPALRAVPTHSAGPVPRRRSPAGAEAPEGRGPRAGRRQQGDPASRAGPRAGGQEIVLRGMAARAARRIVWNSGDRRRVRQGGLSASAPRVVSWCPG
jgi:hypothetical protein